MHRVAAQRATHGTHHVVYSHVPKTGGSAIECVAQAWAEAGMWDLMGHVPKANADVCAARCASTPVLRVVSVRGPYGYGAPRGKDIRSRCASFYF